MFALRRNIIKTGINKNGWILKITDCNNVTVSKGNQSVKMYVDNSNFKVTYNGKTCSYIYDFDDAKKYETECENAIAQCSNSDGNAYSCIDDTFGGYDKYVECAEENIPEEFIAGSFLWCDAEGGYYKALTKKR